MWLFPRSHSEETKALGVSLRLFDWTLFSGSRPDFHDHHGPAISQRIIRFKSRTELQTFLNYFAGHTFVLLHHFCFLPYFGFSIFHFKKVLKMMMDAASFHAAEVWASWSSVPHSFSPLPPLMTHQLYLSLNWLCLLKLCKLQQPSEFRNKVKGYSWHLFQILYMCS